jgi:mono/diheme cytochrome c family protein
MKTVLRIIASIVLVIILAVGIGALYINSSGIPSYDLEEVEFTASNTSAQIERGKKLAGMLCASCHLDPATRKLSGKHMPDVPSEFGVIHAPNITNDATNGIGSWTDGDLVRLLRTGLKKDGVYAPPYMVKLPHMSDKDIDAIISFLRSDDRMVAADPTPSVPCEPTFLSKLLCRVAFKPLPMPTRPVAEPDTTDREAWGRYLVHGLDCYPCHSADFKTMDPLEPTKSGGYMGGGNLPLDMDGKPMPTPNLTPHPEHGIGSWSEAKFIKAVRTGQVEGGNALRYPMLPYTGLTESEAGAIYAYLMSIPEIDNQVEKAP